jgi:hypothetical protein
MKQYVIAFTEDELLLLKILAMREGAELLNKPEERKLFEVASSIVERINATAVLDIVIKDIDLLLSKDKYGE